MKPIIFLISLLATACVSTPDSPVPNNPSSAPSFTVHGGGSWKVYEVHNRAALEALGLSNISATIDFSSQRLVATQTDLYSRTEILVGITPTSYILVPHTSGIGNTLTWPATIWMVVPKDERTVGTGRGANMQICEACETGALVHRWLQDPDD